MNTWIEGESMKGIVLEVLENKLVVLTKKGDFIEIDKTNDNVDIGDEVTADAEKRDTKQMLRRFMSAAAVLIMFIMGSYAVYGYYIPQGYINININPDANINASVEMAYNHYGKPIKLHALDKDGNVIINKMNNFRSKSIDTVINELIKNAEEEKVISKDKKNTIVLTITGLINKIDDESLDRSVEQYIKKNNIKAKTMIIRGNKTEYEDAKQSEISTDKFILINIVIQKNPEYRLNDLKDKSVEELLHIINDEGGKYDYYNLQK